MPNRMKFKTPKEMQEAIDAYFKECEGHPLLDDEGQPFTDKYGNNHLIDVDGEAHTIAEWAKITGIAARTIEARVRALGWNVGKALLTAVGGAACV